MDSLRPEDEYADRDDLGLEPVVGSEDPKVREKETFVKYFKMLIIFIPLTLGVEASTSFYLSTRQDGIGLCLRHLRSEQVRPWLWGDHGSKVPLRAPIPAWLRLPGSGSAAWCVRHT